MKRQVVILGSGPAGSATALHLLRAGITPTIVEREEFPRYHIGESLTTDCGEMLRRLDLEELMQQHAFPIKRGVKVHGPADRTSFYVPVQIRTESGSLQPAQTWQVRRSVFDKMLVDTAVERGAELIEADAHDVLLEGDRVRGVRIVRPDGSSESLYADVVVDATGQKTFFAKRGLTGPVHRGRYDRQVALFSQVAGASRDPEIHEGDTALFLRERHHWSWFIPLAPDVVSVGVVADRRRFGARPTADPAFLRQELDAVNPALKARLAGSEFVEDVRAVSSYCYRIDGFTGPGFLCIGDSHRFTDPIFSFGVSFAFNEAELGARAIADHLGGASSSSDNPFAEYEAFVDAGQDIIADMMACFWDHPLAFLAFVHHRYVDEVIDTFAGRIYGDEAGSRDLTRALRRVLSLHAAGTRDEARAS